MSRRLLVQHGSFRVGVLERGWERLAQELGLGGRLVVDTVRALADEVAEVATAAAAEFTGRYGKSPALELILPKVRKQARRVRSQLAT